MNIHEYQAKDIFDRYQIKNHPNRLVSTPEEAFQAAKDLQMPGRIFAVKAQVHAGGRGKGGGIKIVKTAEEVRDAAQKILGKNLVTPQTGHEGKPVEKLLIESTVSLVKEYYVSVILDRGAALPCLIASSEGGVDIEEVAANAPDKIFKKHFSLQGLSQAEATEMAKHISSDAKYIPVFAQIFQVLGKIFLDLFHVLLHSLFGIALHA